MNIYNIDEKGVQLGIAAAARIILPARCRSHFVTQDGNRENITIIEGIGGIGTVIPPLVIYKGSYHQYG